MAGESVHQRGNIMSVTTDYLKEIIFVFKERFIINAISIGNPKTLLTTLSNKKFIFVFRIDFLFVVIACRCTIDNDLGAL